MRAGLVVFDCDGVLTERKNSWGVLHEYFGSRDNRIFAEYYRRGLISYTDWMKIDVALMIHSWGRPITRGDVARALGSIAARPEAKEVVSALRQKYDVAVVSSGVGEVVSRVCAELGIGTCLYNELSYAGDELIPGGVARVPLLEKASIVASLARELGYSMEQVTYIGDDVWDVPVFRAVGNSIAIEPCGDACRAARQVAKSLREVPELVEAYYSGRLRGLQQR